LSSSLLIPASNHASKKFLLGAQHKRSIRKCLNTFDKNALISRQSVMAQRWKCREEYLGSKRKGGLGARTKAKGNPHCFNGRSQILDIGSSIKEAISVRSHDRLSWKRATRGQVAGYGVWIGRILCSCHGRRTNWWTAVVVVGRRRKKE